MRAPFAFAALVALVAGCSSGASAPAGSTDTQIPAPTRQVEPSCQTFHQPQGSSYSLPGQPGHVVPFTVDEAPFGPRGYKWVMLPLSKRKPVTVGIRLGHDLGMSVDAVHFVLRLNSYAGGDGGTAGAVALKTFTGQHADGQHLQATFDGTDIHGTPLGKGVYRVLVNIEEHRTSSSSCEEHGPVDPGLAGASETGFIFGLLSVGGAPRPRGV